MSETVGRITELNGVLKDAYIIGLTSAVKQLLTLLDRNPERLTRAENETIVKIKEVL